MIWFDLKIVDFWLKKSTRVDKWSITQHLNAGLLNGSADKAGYLSVCLSLSIPLPGIYLTSLANSLATEWLTEWLNEWISAHSLTRRDYELALITKTCIRRSKLARIIDWLLRITMTTTTTTMTKMAVFVLAQTILIGTESWSFVGRHFFRPIKNNHLRSNVDLINDKTARIDSNKNKWSIMIERSIDRECFAKLLSLCLCLRR